MTDLAAYEGRASVDYLLHTAASTPLKQRSYALMEIGAGSVVLDAGCGPGIDTLALAARVGPSGRVVGVDHDLEMVRAAIARSSRSGVEQRVAHRCADLAALPLPDEAFDATRCERVLQHVDEPRPVLAELMRVTRRGGRVVLIDTDWSSFSIDTPEVELEARIRTFVLDRVLRNGRAGRQLRRLMTELSMTEIAVEAHTRPITSVAAFRWMAQLDTVERAALTAGILTTDELARWTTWMLQTEREGTFFCTHTQVVAIGRVP